MATKIKQVTGYDIKPGDPIVIAGAVLGTYEGYRSETSAFVRFEDGQSGCALYESIQPRAPVDYKYPETTYEPPKPDLKDTNPKDAIGSTKLPLHLVPDSAPAYMALAFCEGATKYGAFNWRVAGVRASIYMSAARRHQAKFWNGEWADPKTGVPHLASAMACMAIILDAKLVNKLTDDRPPAAPIGDLIDGMAETVQHLQEMHKDMNPRHWTIDDSDPLLGILNEPV